MEIQEPEFIIFTTVSLMMQPQELLITVSNFTLKNKCSTECTLAAITTYNLNIRFQKQFKEFQG